MTPMLSLAAAVIVTVLRRATVEPLAGLVIETVGAMPSLTVTERGALVVLLSDVSTALAVSV